MTETPKQAARLMRLPDRMIEIARRNGTFRGSDEKWALAEYSRLYAITKGQTA